MLSLFVTLSVLKDDWKVIRPLAFKRLILSNFGKLIDFGFVRIRNGKTDQVSLMRITLKTRRE